MRLCRVFRLIWDLCSESLEIRVAALVNFPLQRHDEKSPIVQRASNLPIVINHGQQIPQGLPGDKRLPNRYRWKELMKFNFEISFHSLTE
jgi:hypothetical protein